MIYEELPFQFDVEKLRAQVEDVVSRFEPHMVGKTFGGWSVLSSNGSYLDGWSSGYRAYDPAFMPGATMKEKFNALGTKHSTAYNKPTEVCTGYLDEVMREIAKAGLGPCRARLSLLRAHGESTWHRDGVEGEYAVRLHVPIVSSESCLFCCEEGSVHLPANGRAYLLRVDCLHQVINPTDHDRIHLIMSVRDTAGFSKYHRYPADP